MYGIIRLFFLIVVERIHRAAVIPSTRHLRLGLDIERVCVAHIRKNR